MKSRLPNPRERAATARRMGHTLQHLAEENAAEDETIGGVVDRFLTGTAIVGAGAVVALWNGTEVTLGHVLALLAGAGAAVGIWWRGRERRARTR